ncbi:MAG: T9SS type A sorting domain-containing protein [FCB group bacterium]|nr:T9SS type A sorting domain-containing protein [FCB group bacterium]
MYVAVDSGVTPVTGLGVNWDPCIFAIIGHYTAFEERSDLTDYSGIRMWVKPGTVTGDQDAIFKINIIESSTTGNEKWMSPKYYVTDLNPNGEYIYFDFNDFTEYWTGSGEPMDRSSIKISFLWLSYDAQVLENSTATIWVDNIVAVPSLQVDDFEGYASDAELQAAYPWVGVISGGTVANSLDTTGGFDQTQAMRIDFDFASGDANPWAYVGGPLNNGNPVDWSDFDGISVWVKATTTGDSPQIIQLAVHEGDTTSGNDWGDKMHSASIDVSTLNPDGEYVFLNFDDFVDYSGYGGPKDDGILDASDIRNFFVFTKYSGTASQSSSITVLVDDIVPYVSQYPPPGYIDDFERFSSTSNLLNSYPWFGAVVGDSISVSLNATGGANGSRAMQVDTYFSSGETDPYLYAGGPVRDNMRNWTAYDSLGVWLKASETGDSPQFIDFAIHEGDSTDLWGDKFNSVGINISDIDVDGEYFTIAFSDFVDYGGFSGAKDDGILDLSDIRSFFVRVKYSGSATQNSIANVTVDDITLIEGEDQGTHLDDNFESYADSAALMAKWSEGPWTWSDGVIAIDLNSTGGANGSKAMQMDFSYPAGADGPGGITGYYTSSGDRVDMTDYSGISLWLKPLATTGDRPYFTLRLLESSTTGSDKWIATRSIGNLDPNGEYVYFDFNDFTWYAGADTNQAMDRTSIKVEFLGLAYDGVSANGGSASLLIDDVLVLLEPPLIVGTHLDDDFNSYANDGGLVAKWDDGPWPWGGADMSISLDSDNGTEDSPALQISFSCAAGSDGPAGVIGYYTPYDRRVDMTDYYNGGIGFWIKPVSVTGDVPYFTLRLLESSSIGGEKWRSPNVSLSDIDPEGEFVYFNFQTDFTEYNTGSGEALDLSSIKENFLGMGFDGVAANGISSDILVDDIKVYYRDPRTTHLDDNFEAYADSSALVAKWAEGPYPWGGADMSIDLNTNGGAEGSKALQIDFSYPAGSGNPGGVIGYYTSLDRRTDLTGYDGIRLWIKKVSSSGDEPFFTLRLLESSTIGGEKWRSPQIILSDLDPNGEYVTLLFNDFYEYNTGSGEPIDLTSIKINFLGLDYDGTSANGGSADILVDDIQVVSIVAVDPNVVGLLPDKFALKQNYPNPFNPATTIQYDLPITSNVRLIIYDILGREVIRLIDNEVGAGFHAIRWNGRDKYGKNVSSGVYIYLLNAGDFVQTKKLMLLK